MAREVFVEIGGAERRLMFGAARAAVEIERRLKKAPIKVVDEELMPWLHGSVFSAEALAFCLWLGLRHEDKRLKEETVFDWLDEAFAASEGGQGAAMKLCSLVRDAMLLSGVCGFVLDQYRKEDEAPEEGDGDQGKGAVRPAEAP